MYLGKQLDGTGFFTLTGKKTGILLANPSEVCRLDKASPRTAHNY